MGTHLITGAGSGVGAVLAERLHERGDHLVLVSRNQGRVEQLEARFPGSLHLVADLANVAMAEATGWVLPDRLDSVVHAAGIVELGAVAELGREAWRETLDVNLVAPALITQGALPALRAARGTVVFVNSGQGLAASPGWSAYAAAKHGLRALADALRAEEAEHGVRVTSVYPGRTATPMQRKVHEQEGRDYDASRWIDPATVADAIVRVLDLAEDATIADLTIRPR